MAGICACAEADVVPEYEFRLGFGFGSELGSRPTAMASGWRGVFGFGVEYFEQFALGEGAGQGACLGREPIWVTGESPFSKGFNLIREKGGGTWWLLGGAMGNWPPCESRLASLLLVGAMGGGAASAVRVLFLLLGLLLGELLVSGVSGVSVLVSVPGLCFWGPSLVPLRAPLPSLANSPMCGGSRSSAGRRISVMPEA